MVAGRFRLAADIFFVAAASIIFGYWSVTRGVDLNWDLQNYHHYAGWSVWTGREFGADTAPAGITTYFHPGIPLISYLSNSYLLFPWNKFPILFLQFLSLPALVALSRQISGHLSPSLFKELSRHLALWLSVLSPLWLSELGTSFFSSTTAPLILWSLVFLIASFRLRGARAITLLLLSGALSGLATGLKLTNAPFSVALFFALVFGLVGLKAERLLRVTALTIGGIAGFLFTVDWYLKVFNEFGSPIFPLYNRIFRADLYPEINFRDKRWVLENPVEIVAFIFEMATGTQKTVELFFADPRFALAGVLLLALLFGVSSKASFSLSERVVFAFWASSFMLWATIFAYQRYLVPSELLIGLVTWVLTMRLFSSGMRPALFLGVALVFTVTSISVPNWGHAQPPSKDYFAASFNAVLPDEFRNQAAIVVLVGPPIAYLTSHFHPESTFHALGVSEMLDEKTKRQIALAFDEPVFVLAPEMGVGDLTEKLIDYQILEANDSLICVDIDSLAARQLLCRIGSGLWTTDP